MGDGSAAPRSFRFGVQISSAENRNDWRQLARKAEDLGYSVLSVADHLDDQFATMPALMAAADATDEIRLGAMVMCNDYRHPAVLAKEAATVDLLSGGRLELGLGAGWMTTDYATAGLQLDPPGTRIDRLDESLVIVRSLLAGETVTIDGTHYQIDGLVGSPRSPQRPHPPIFVGGGGRRMLTLAASHADIVGLNINLAHGRIDETAGPTATAEATDQKIDWIREAAGDRFGAIELQTRVHLAAVTDDRAGLAAVVGPTLGLDQRQAMESPHGLAGTVDEIIEQCERRRERWGISYITIGGEALDAFAPVVAALRGR